MGRPLDADGDQTRRSLIDAAVHCFAHQGIARTTQRSVADRANVTQGTLYHYYRTKEELFHAAYLWAIAELYAELSAAIESHHTLRLRLNAFLDRAVALTATRPELLLMSVRAWSEQGAADRATPPKSEAVQKFFARIAGDAIERRELEPERRDELLNVCRSLLWGIAGISMTGQEPMPSTLAGLQAIVNGCLINDR